MKSLTFIRKTLQILICTVFILACRNETSTKVRTQKEGYCTIIIKNNEQIDTLYGGGQSFLHITSTTPASLDTLYLKPTEIFTVSKFDSVYENDQALNYGNYNAIFVNSIYKNYFKSWTFAKSQRPKSGDIEVRSSFDYKINSHSYLYVLEDGRASYQNNPFSENHKYEIEFTPTFAKILQNLKNQK